MSPANKMLPQTTKNKVLVGIEGQLSQVRKPQQRQTKIQSADGYTGPITDHFSFAGSTIVSIKFCKKTLSSKTSSLSLAHASLSAEHSEEPGAEVAPPYNIHSAHC